MTAVQTVIVCGGKGTRAYPHTGAQAVARGGRRAGPAPRDGHCASQGYIRFLLAAGYRAEMIEAFARSLPAAWDVTVVDTGEETNTGGRAAGCGHLLEGAFP